MERIIRALKLIVLILFALPQFADAQESSGEEEGTAWEQNTYLGEECTEERVPSTEYQDCIMCQEYKDVEYWASNSPDGSNPYTTQPKDYHVPDGEPTFIDCQDTEVDCMGVSRGLAHTDGCGNCVGGTSPLQNVPGCGGGGSDDPCGCNAAREAYMAEAMNDYYECDAVCVITGAGTAYCITYVCGPVFLVKEIISQVEHTQCQFACDGTIFN